MSKIVRYEFMGSTVLFTVLCLSVVLLPVAVLYLVNGTFRIETDVDDPEEFVRQFRSGKLRK